jgi:hypothetical protein
LADVSDASWKNGKEKEHTNESRSERIREVKKTKELKMKRDERNYS